MPRTCVKGGVLVHLIRGARFSGFFGNDGFQASCIKALAHKAV
jgi:hypothetical protein